MKVIVRCANNRVTKADMEREIERLFQENKDLRLSESHLKDELNLVSQQSEVRRQKMVEKDKEIDRMRATIANVGADRDNFEAAYKQVLQWWEAAQSKAVKAEAAADEYRIAAMESDCRVNELEKQLEWARNKNEEWAAVAQGLRNTIDEMKAQKEADDKKCEETCAACNERYEDVLADRNRLREEVEELEAEVDTCRHNIDGYIEGNRRMRAEYEKKLEAEQDQTKHWRKKYDNLKENYDELVQLHREWDEEIDRLRKTVTELQSNRSLTNEIHEMLYKYLTTVNTPSADK
jgi:chromosome segregation ATPase